jgi:hypothetical protein
MRSNFTKSYTTCERTLSTKATLQHSSKMYLLEVERLEEIEEFEFLGQP